MNTGDFFAVVVNGRGGGGGRVGTIRGRGRELLICYLNIHTFFMLWTYISLL